MLGCIIILAACAAFAAAAACFAGVANAEASPHSDHLTF
jgi:hypothetical protein